MSTETPSTFEKSRTCVDCNESASDSLHSLIEGQPAKDDCNNQCPISCNDRNLKKRNSICCRSQSIFHPLRLSRPEFIILTFSGLSCRGPEYIANHHTVTTSEDDEHKHRRDVRIYKFLWTTATQPGKYSISQIIWGIIFIIISISGYIFPPLDFMLWEKLNMRPGFPPYEWWADPPDQVRMRAHVFNVTNHERFMEGLDAKINVEEIGPFVYLEKLKHSNISFNENSTMTYTAKRYLIYLPDDNTIDMNQTIIVPNLALLGMASYLYDSNYFVKNGFLTLAGLHSSKFFVKLTIYQYLWDFREKLLETSSMIAPGMVPTDNMGMLSRVYDKFSDEYTVKIGPQWGHKNFFKIDQLDGEPNFKELGPNTCEGRVSGATEGVMYHQYMSKSDVLLCLRKTACKLMPLYFDEELTMDGLQVYRYNLSENAFDRQKNSTDCVEADASLPDGISDASKCFYDIPMVASYPHFYTGSPPKDKYVTGLKPDKEKHNTYVNVEPLTGTPYDAVARLQCNLRVHDLSGFNSRQYNRFSNLILPIGWIEYHQEGLPSYVRRMIYFMVVILPPLSTVIFIITLFLGSSLIIKQIISHKIKKDVLPSIVNLKKTNIDNLADNKLFSYEKEMFLRKPQLSR